MTEQLITKDELVRALYAAWPHTVFSQALEDATGLPRGATIDFETAAAAGASFAGLERWADVVLEVLADRLATIQRQDERVRELEAALDAVLSSCGARGKYDSLEYANAVSAAESLLKDTIHE